MKIFHNALHHAHAGRQEMFRGKLVPCHESPSPVWPGFAFRTVAALDLPTVWVFEGGYAVDEVGINTSNVLEGFDSCTTHAPVRKT